MAMHPSQQPYAYVKHSTGERCKVLKDTEGVHCRRCCHLTHCKRCLVHLGSMATKQIVSLNPRFLDASAGMLPHATSDADQHMQTSLAGKRADLVLHSHAGERIIVEITLAHVPYREAAIPALQRIEKTKLAAYGGTLSSCYTVSLDHLSWRLLLALLYTHLPSYWSYARCSMSGDCCRHAALKTSD